MIHMDFIAKPDMVKQLVRKMAPPLVTLVSAAPEVQWVALRNMNLILQKRPEVLSSELRIFFCKYNDPSYVKLEKLEIMIKLANERNVDMLLSELKEYASEVDLDFVRRSIRAIGQCAIKIDAAAERCVHVLLDLIATKVTYVVQEAVVVIKVSFFAAARSVRCSNVRICLTVCMRAFMPLRIQDIFRKYPQNYEGIIPTLCANLEDLDEPEAKASLIWILGEYAEKIDNSEDLLASFLDGFVDEPYQVQFQILVAIVKLFLKKPDGAAQGVVQRVLELATKEADNPDLRDRAFIYWRLLSSSDPEAGRSIVLAQRPPISIPLTSVSPALLSELIGDLSSLASAYHKPAATFIGKVKYGADDAARSRKSSHHITREQALATVVQGQNAENLLDFGDDDANGSADSGAAGKNGSTTGGLGALDEMISMDGPAAPSGLGAAPGMSTSASANNQLNDLLGLFDAAPGADQPGAKSGLDALSSLGSIPPLSASNTGSGMGMGGTTSGGQGASSSGGGDLLDLL